jgi:hypothetical protein
LNLLTYLAAGALLGALVRWWRPQPGWRWIGAYWLAAGAFFAAPLATPLLQVPTDIAYQFRPWSATVVAGFRPANPLLSDVPLQALPFRALVRERLLRGEAPLWAGELGTGQPLLGNAQSAPFSPFTLLTLHLQPVDALAVGAALKLFLSLLLTDALLAALGAGRAGAAFAAVAYSFSVFAICWAYHPHGTAMAWVPGVLLALVLVRRGERGGVAGLAACAAGLALAGHPETLAHTALAAAGVAAVLLASPGGPPRARCGLRLAAGAALAACLAAPALLPVVEALGGSARGHVAGAVPLLMQPPAFEPRLLRLQVEPLAFGSPRDGTWWGPLNFNEMASGYGGLLALALAAAGAVVLRGRLLAVLAAGAAALAAALGVRPVLRLLTALPPLDQAMNGRLRLFWVLAVAVAAGLGLDALSTRPRRAVAAAIAIAAATLALALDRPPGAGPPQTWWAVTLAGGALAAAGFLVVAASRHGQDGDSDGADRTDGSTAEGVAEPALPAGKANYGGNPNRTTGTAAEGEAVAGYGGHEASRRAPGGGTADRPPSAPRAASAAASPTLAGIAAALPWLLVTFLVLDLGLLNAGFLPVLLRDFDLSPVPPIDRLTGERAAAPDSPWRLMAYDPALLPNLSALYGLWDARANDPMHPARAALVVSHGIRPRHWTAQEVAGAPPRYPREFLSYLAVRYLFTPPGERLALPWHEDWSGASGTLWRNPGALPLFFMPAAGRRAVDAGDALRATAANGDFAALGVFETAAGREPIPAGDPQILSSAEPTAAGTEPTAAGTAPAAPTPQRGTVRIDRARDNGFDLTAATPTGGLVVSSVSFDPGWRAAVDGRPTAPLRVNAAFLGLALPPGTHRVHLDYRPAGWVWGLRLCGLALAACLLVPLARSPRYSRRRASTLWRRPYRK